MTTALTPAHPDQAPTVDAVFFRRELLGWYGLHKRALPWRESRDPYRIWLSEIMLQQTRVAAVMEHYRRFLQRFPTVFELAAATEPEVLTAWSGLGYYRRARMMHRAAQEVVAERGGVLPGSAAALRGLPGIGGYTSAAIASIAFGEPVAVVDGNVARVLARVAGWSAAEKGFRARVERLANELVDSSQPGEYNQAIMELGATVCLPRGPLCLHCPVRPQCRTQGEHTPAPRAAMTTREIAYGLQTRENAAGETEVRLEQRPSDVSLMAGMWELPEVQAGEESEKALLTVKHSITVTNYTVRVFALHGTQDAGAAEDSRMWHTQQTLPGLPLTGLARKILRRLHLLESLHVPGEEKPVAAQPEAQSDRLRS